MEIRKFSIPGILPSLEAVIRRLGYNPARTDISNETLELVRQNMRESLKMVVPSGVAADDVIRRVSDDGVALESGLEFRSRKAAETLRGCEKITLLACTVGPGITGEVARLTSLGNMTESVIMDAVGSEAVEEFADYINGVLAIERRIQGLVPVMRYSPGYGDLLTNVHARMLQMLKASEAGIKSDPETHILYPEKSITAFIGWKKA